MCNVVLMLQGHYIEGLVVVREVRLRAVRYKAIGSIPVKLKHSEPGRPEHIVILQEFENNQLSTTI